MKLYGAPYNLYGPNGKVIIKHLNEFNKHNNSKLSIEDVEKLKKRNDEYRKTGNPDVYLENRNFSIKKVK